MNDSKGSTEQTNGFAATSESVQDYTDSVTDLASCEDNGLNI